MDRTAQAESTCTTTLSVHAIAIDDIVYNNRESSGVRHANESVVSHDDVHLAWRLFQSDLELLTNATWISCFDRREARQRMCRPRLRVVDQICRPVLGDLARVSIKSSTLDAC